MLPSATSRQTHEEVENTNKATSLGNDYMYCKHPNLQWSCIDVIAEDHNSTIDLICLTNMNHEVDSCMGGKT